METPKEEIIMTKHGFWKVNIELIVEGEKVGWYDLDKATREHIAESIKEGYNGGEILIEED